MRVRRKGDSGHAGPCSPMTPNRTIDRTCYSGLRPLTRAGHHERLDRDTSGSPGDPLQLILSRREDQ
jgi:hypothetical protein